MPRLKIIDFLTGWDVSSALEEIKNTQYCRYATDTIQKKRIHAHRRKAISMGYSINEVTEKIDYIENKRVNHECNKYLLKKTGGSSGAPLIYRSSKKAQGFLWASIIRSWMEVGYSLGEKIVFLGGSSIIDLSMKKRLFYFILNIVPFSSFGVSDNDNFFQYSIIKKNKIKYIYGYANAILEFKNYLYKNNLRLDVDGIICTAEQLSDRDRQEISDYFNCKVIRQYGANDGGISGFECECNDGYHILITRSLFEIINNEVVSTDLINEAQFFTKYKVGDIGKIDNSPCSCGVVYPKLTELSGRSNDILIDGKGRSFHSEFFSHYFRNNQNIQKWQIVQTRNDIEVVLSFYENNFDYSSYSAEVLEYFELKTDFDNIKINLNGEFRLLSNGKIKFVMIEC